MGGVQGTAEQQIKPLRAAFCSFAKEPRAEMGNSSSIPDGKLRSSILISRVFKISR